MEIVQNIKHLIGLLWSRRSLWFFVPWLLVLVLGFFWMPHFRGYAKEVLGFGLFSLAFVSFYWLWPAGKFKRFWGFFTALVLSFFCYAKLSFYYQYGAKLSISALFVIFETNGTEAGDFLATYFSNPASILALVLIVYLLIFYKRIVKTSGGQSRGFIAKLILIAICGLSLFGISWKFKEENIAMATLDAYDEYRTTKDQLKQQLAQPIGTDFNLKFKGDSRATYVVVIGESTSRRHMQLYGYERETNPLLNARKNELIVFDSVISPHVHTILSFEKAFTLKTFEQPNPAENVSLVQMANQAGLATHWISGQRPVGIHESVPTIIGNAAAKKVFVNTDDYKDDFYDQELIEPFKEALATSGPKVIFLHLMGTHVGYYKRYPAEFAQFTQGQSRAQEYIDHYDNAVLYNDYIIDRLIQILEAESDPVRLMYFSDHGDDVYDEHNATGHNEYRPTRPMYEIPFLLWPRSEFVRDSINLMTARRYSLEDLPNSFADFCQLNFDGFSAERSLLNPNFKVRKRTIKDTIDYDSDW